MRVLDCPADPQKQLQAPFDGQVTLVTILRDLHPLHQLHHEIGPARVSGSGIQRFRDARMIRHGQGLALGLKTRDHFTRIHPQLDDLYGHAAAYRNLLLGKINNPAPSGPDFLEKPVAPNPITRPFEFPDPLPWPLAANSRLHLHAQRELQSTTNATSPRRARRNFGATGGAFAQVDHHTKRFPMV